MIHIDTYRCAYCGGCISACPQEALTLRELRLEVSEDCIDCGDCVSACPVGALSLDEWIVETKRVACQPRYDLIVIGAGPAGSTAAYEAARAGLSVLLLEKRQEIGSPVRCAEGVGREALSAFCEPDPRWISTRVSKIEITTVEGERRDSWRSGGGDGYILERRVFDRFLAEKAAQAGAEVRVKTAATGLLIENGQVCGIRLRRADFMPASGELEIEAKIVIGADGVESQAGRWAGLPLGLPLADTMVCVQYLLAGIDIDQECNYFFLGQDVAPGGYAWIFPKGEGRANVGLGVQANLWEREKNHPARSGQGESEYVSVGDYLNRFIESDPRLSQGSPVTLIAGNVPSALSPARLSTAGFIVIGDAARQADPLTGGGIIHAMQAGKLAAIEAVRAIESGDTSADALRRYEYLWQLTAGMENQRNYRLRAKFPPETRTGERFIRAFALAVAS